MSSDLGQWTWAAEEGEYRCPGGLFECHPDKAACTMDVKTSRRFCCDYEGVCWTEGTKCGSPDTFRIQREDEDPFCCMKDRERPDPNRGGACFSTLDNPLLDIPVKELQVAYSKALDAGVNPTDAPSFDPFNLNPKPVQETTSSSKKAPSTTTTSTPKPTPVEPTPSPEDEETTLSTPTTTTDPAETSDSHSQTRPSDEEDDDVTSITSTTFDLTKPLASETSSSSAGGYLGGSSDSTLQETSSNGLSTGALAGVIVAGVVGGLLIAVGIFFLLRRKKHQKRALNGGGPNGEMIHEPDDNHSNNHSNNPSNDPSSNPSNNNNPNHPLEVMGVTLLFKKPKNQPITFGSDADSITDMAPTSRTSQSLPTEVESPRPELVAPVPVEAQSAPVAELSTSKSQRWRRE